VPGEANAIKAIFLAALEKTSSAERAAYLDDACAQDPQVRERVEALLNAHDKPDRLLDHPAGQHLAPECDASALAFLEPSEKSGSIGRLGHYEVLEVLGHGGMGVVLRAFDEKLHRVVALKTLAPALASNGSARQRFAREARAAAAVTHENVIAIHAVEDAGPVPYLVMQCIDGETLQEKLDSTGPLELRAILRIGLQIAEGLAAAHRLGLIHRDIKPANILLEDSVERVRITDFGLARAADDVSLTQSGYIAGTPLYMSPEQARGEPVDHRTDLFSLGSVLYALCVGDPPFRAENSMAVLKRVCEDTPRSIRAVNPAIPSWLEQIVARLHAKSPASRFQTASEVAVLLSECLVVLQTGIATEKLIADTVAIGKPTAVEWAGPRRLPRTWAWMAVAIVMLTTLVAGSFFRGQRPSLPPDSGPVEPLTAPFVPAAAVQGQRRCAQQLQSSTLRTNSIGIQLALIPPGTFLMGSNEADIERHTSLNPGFWWNQFYGNELPCHRVTLSRPFYLGTTEVTVGQFRAFVDATGFKTEPETDGVGGSWAARTTPSGTGKAQALSRQTATPWCKLPGMTRLPFADG
jgi:hypothetical protein